MISALKELVLKPYTNPSDEYEDAVQSAKAHPHDMKALYDWYDKTHNVAASNNVSAGIATITGTSTGMLDNTTLGPWYDPNGIGSQPGQYTSPYTAPYMPGTGGNSIGGGNIALPNNWPAPNDNEAVIKALTMLVEDLRTKNTVLEQRMKDLEAQMNTILTGGDD
jgi:hypothetical protein